MCECFKLCCILSLLMQVSCRSSTVMNYNKSNLLFYCVYYNETVTIDQKNTTDAFVSDRPKIICRHCADQQTDSLVTEFQPHYRQ